MASTNILMGILWIQISLINIIRSVRSSEIRENGIYSNGYFYKWSTIQRCSFVSPNTIEFEASRWFNNIDRSFKFIIKEEFKFKAEEILSKNLREKVQLYER